DGFSADPDGVRPGDARAAQTTAADGSARRFDRTASKELRRPAKERSVMLAFRARATPRERETQSCRSLLTVKLQQSAELVPHLQAGRLVASAVGGVTAIPEADELLALAAQEADHVTQSPGGVAIRCRFRLRPDLRQLPVHCVERRDHARQHLPRRLLIVQPFRLAVGQQAYVQI